MILDIESAQQLNERESYFTDLKQSYGLIVCIIGTLIIPKGIPTIPPIIPIIRDNNNSDKRTTNEKSV